MPYLMDSVIRDFSSKVVVIDVMGAQRKNFCLTPIKVMIQVGFSSSQNSVARVAPMERRWLLFLVPSMAGIYIYISSIPPSKGTGNNHRFRNIQPEIHSDLETSQKEKPNEHFNGVLKDEVYFFGARPYVQGTIC